VDSVGIGLGSQEFVVEVTDTNGCINTDTVTVGFFDCTGIDEIPGLETFSIFPNPNDGSFTMGIGSNRAVNLNVFVYNNSGKVVHSQENIVVDRQFQRRITLNDAPAGIYYVVLEREGRRVFEKFVVRK
jgi:hypothetical protein